MRKKGIKKYVLRGLKFVFCLFVFCLFVFCLFVFCLFFFNLWKTWIQRINQSKNASLISFGN